MKLGLLQFSFCVSVGCHVLVFGVAALTGSLYRAPSVLIEDSPLVLTMIAAPAAPVETVVEAVRQSVEAVAPATKPTSVPEPEPEAIEELPPVPEPIFFPEPQKQESPPSTPEKLVTSSTPPRVEAVTAPAKVQGDGSSSQPGNDPTTAEGRPGALARPNYLKNPEPEYPLQARRRGQEGLVLLEVRVATNGRAVEVTIKQSSGYPLLDEAALKAVRGWDFEPARIGPIAVESRIEVPVRFKLSQ